MLRYGGGKVVKFMKKAVQIFGWAMLACYLLVLVYWMFIQNLTFWYDYRDMEFALFFRLRTNFVPFRSIAEYLARAAEGSMNAGYIVGNLLGNFVLGVPLGVLLPCLFPRLQTLAKTLAAAFGFMLVLEVAQLLLRFGTFDIDDLILQMLGCILGYGMLKLPVINRLLRRISIWRIS